MIHQYSFNKAEDFGGLFSAVDLHAEFLADATLGPVFSHVEQMGDDITIFFTESVAPGLVVRTIVSQHVVVSAPFNPFTDVGRDS